MTEKILRQLIPLSAQWNTSTSIDFLGDVIQDILLLVHQFSEQPISNVASKIIKGNMDIFSVLLTNIGKLCISPGWPARTTKFLLTLGDSL